MAVRFTPRELRKQVRGNKRLSKAVSAFIREHPRLARRGEHVHGKSLVEYLLFDLETARCLLRSRKLVPLLRQQKWWTETRQVLADRRVLRKPDLPGGLPVTDQMVDLVAFAYLWESKRDLRDHYRFLAALGDPSLLLQEALRYRKELPSGQALGNFRSLLQKVIDRSLEIKIARVSGARLSKELASTVSFRRARTGRPIRREREVWADPLMSLLRREATRAGVRPSDREVAGAASQLFELATGKALNTDSLRKRHRSEAGAKLATRPR